jgi:ubiquinone/menaquinone biosynthesis C-methylase UbiE
VRAGRAEAIPFGDDRFDIALAQLVLHFVSDPTVTGVELRRVVRPGGIIGACVWDFEVGMQMLRLFWDAALEADPAAPDEARTMRFGRDGEIAEWLGDVGLEEVTETTLAVTSTYTGFDEVWSGFLAGIGPAGSYCVSLSADQQEAVRQGMFDRLGAPDGALTLTATARSAHGHVPG